MYVNMHEGNCGGLKQDIGYLRARDIGGVVLPKSVKGIKLFSTLRATGDFDLLAVSQAACMYLKMFH